MQKTAAVGEERPRQLDDLRLLERRLRDAVLVEDEDPRAGIREEDRRVRRDEELRAALGELVHSPDQCEHAAHGERGLGLVEDVEAAVAEALKHEREERLAV